MSALGDPAERRASITTIEANIAAAVAATPVTHSRLSVPVLKRPDIGVYILLVVLPFAGYAARTFQTQRTIVQTKTHKVSVEEQFGKPTTSVPGEQVNANFQGLTCDIFQAKAVVLCHG